jgi:prolipoprotein diacylglyceryltransferase
LEGTHEQRTVGREADERRRGGLVTVLATLPSPTQGVWELGPLPIRAYALCIVAGIVAAVLITEKRWVARGGAAGDVLDIAVWAVPFGIVGGRLYHVISSPRA